jgi:transposase
MSTMERSRGLLFFLGNDWAEEHHDVELQNEAGKVLARAKLPEGIAGITKLHAMIGQYLGDEDDAEVVVGIETERGPWVQALIAAGYHVYPVNPLQVARFREPLGVSGAKSDISDAHVLAYMVRTYREQLRPIAGDSPEAEAVKVISRAHKTLVWERTRHLLRLRHALREFFPAALVAFDDLTARQSGKKKVVLARHVHNDRLVDALGLQAFSALSRSPGARAYYDQIRRRGAGHRAALRQLGNRLVGILHGCLKTGSLYDEATAWPSNHDQQVAA